MEVYIIRIFRRDDTDPRLIAGIVEEPETLQERVFANIDELLDVPGRKAASLTSKMRGRKTTPMVGRIEPYFKLEGSRS